MFLHSCSLFCRIFDSSCLSAQIPLLTTIRQVSLCQVMQTLDYYELFVGAHSLDTRQSESFILHCLSVPSYSFLFCLEGFSLFAVSIKGFSLFQPVAVLCTWVVNLVKVNYFIPNRSTHVILLKNTVTTHLLMRLDEALFNLCLFALGLEGFSILPLTLYFW